MLEPAVGQGTAPAVANLRRGMRLASFGGLLDMFVAAMAPRYRVGVNGSCASTVLWP